MEMFGKGGGMPPPHTDSSGSSGSPPAFSNRRFCEHLLAQYAKFKAAVRG